MNWDQALNVVLRDTDSLSDWIAHHCYHREVGEESARKVAGQISLGHLMGDVHELLYVLLTDHDPIVVARAKRALRDRYGMDKSCEVKAVQWAAEDAEMETVEMDDE
jgi:hypothetical protein